MDVRELRIENYLQYFGNVVQVEGIVKESDGYGIQLSGGDFASINSNSLEPIPLDEDWLGNFGAKKNHFDNGHPNQYRIGNRLFVLRNGCWTDYGSSVALHYVHDLQNLYFVLTGEELTFKNQ